MMRNSWKLLSLLLVVSILAAVVTPALAAGNTDCEVDLCLPFTEALVLSIKFFVRDRMIAFAKGVTKIIWLIDRIAAHAFELAIHENIWMGLLDGVVDTLRGMMPGVLKDLIGGGNGLLYVALMIAGITMTIPMASMQSRLVNPGQAILFAAIILVVFGGGIAGNDGYDLIAALEQFRMTIIETVISAGDEGNPSAIFTNFFDAGRADLSLDPLFVLPEGFEARYFPKPGEFITIRTVFIETPINLNTGIADFQMESEASMAHRESLAPLGVAVAMMSLTGGVVALLIALTFAFLATAALGLIVFFFAALPMGLFEFGKPILFRIFEAYLRVFVLSIGAAIFVGLIAAAAEQVGASDDFGELVQMALFMVPFIGVLTAFVKWSFGTLLATGSIFQRSVAAVFAMDASPGLVRQAVGATLRTAGTMAPLAMPGVGGFAAGIASNLLAGRLAADTPDRPRRGDVFAEMRKNDGGVDVTNT